MSLLYRIALPAGAALTAVLAVAAPAAAAPTPAAPGVSIYDGAHIGFDDPNSPNHSLMVDLDREGRQAALLDVEWTDRTCDAPQAPMTCVDIYREAYDVVASKAYFSLQRTSAAADLTYREGRRTCVYTVAADGWDNGECTSAPSTTGRTRIEVTWIGSGEIDRSEGVDSEGRRRITWRRGGHASGTAFGEQFPVEFSSIFQLAHIITFN